MVKALERRFKRALARLLVVLFWRPGRHRRAQGRLARPREVLVVRVDDRVGEALLLTPILAALRALPDRPRTTVLVHPRVRRILTGHPDVDALEVLDRRRLWLGPWGQVLKRLRRRDFDVVVDCGNWSEPSVTHAVVSRLAGPRAAVVGPAVAPLAGLRTHPVDPRPGVSSELAQRLHLLSPLGLDGVAPPMRPRTPQVRSEAVRSLLHEVDLRPHAVVNPGGRLDWRRVPTSVFVAAARALDGAGRVPLITWGPGEEDLAAEVASAVPGARLAPPTDLDELAALMGACGLTVCNNTGPMHLSVAVGAPTLQLFLHMEPERWGHPEAPHQVVDLTAMPRDRWEEAVAEAVSTMAQTPRLPLRPPAV